MALYPLRAGIAPLVLTKPAFLLRLYQRLGNECTAEELSLAIYASGVALPFLFYPKTKRLSTNKPFTILLGGIKDSLFQKSNILLLTCGPVKVRH